MIFGAGSRLGWANQDYVLYGTAGGAVARDEGVTAILAENGGAGANGGPVVAARGGTWRHRAAPEAQEDGLSHFAPTKPGVGLWSAQASKPS